MVRGIFYIVAAAAVFVAITFFEQMPVLGWFGGLVSIAAWIVLTGWLLSDSEGDVIRSGFAIPWAAMLGATSGFIGALTSWLAQTGNLFGFTTPAGDRFGAAFGFVGSLIGIVYWPVIGVIVCAGTAVAITGRRVGRLRADDRRVITGDDAGRAERL